MSDDQDSVSEAERQELIRRAEELQKQAQELKERLDAHIGSQRPSSLAIAGRVVALFGIPLAGGVAVWWLLDSIVFGILAPVALFIPTFLVLERIVGTGNAGPPIGSRGWEAQQNVRLLGDVLDARRRELSTSDDPDRLRREITFLEQQRVDELGKVADRSPGRGYVGFEAYDGD